MVCAAAASAQAHSSARPVPRASPARILRSGEVISTSCDGKRQMRTASGGCGLFMTSSGSRRYPTSRSDQERRGPGRLEGAANVSSGTARSEEHTSELQSPCNLVCRLLLEKKNTPRRIPEDIRE